MRCSMSCFRSSGRACFIDGLAIRIMSSFFSPVTVLPAMSYIIRLSRFLSTAFSAIFRLTIAQKRFSFLLVGTNLTPKNLDDPNLLPFLRTYATLDVVSLFCLEIIGSLQQKARMRSRPHIQSGRAFKTSLFSARSISCGLLPGGDSKRGDLSPCSCASRNHAFALFFFF